MADLKRSLFALFGLVFVAALLAPPEMASAQRRTRRPRRRARPSEQPAKNLPIAVVNVASAKRLLQEVEATFKHAGKPQIYDVLKSFLGNVDDLKGMDREKPFGVMLFLGSGLPPSIAPVGYVPVKNIRELLKSLANGPFTSKKIAGKQGRYELIGRNGSLYLAVVAGYAYVSDKLENLDQDFPDPAKVTASLSTRYDVAAAVNLNSVAKESRELFAAVFRTTFEAELQQHDGEPKAAYEARRARGERDLEWIEAFLLDCEKVVIGLDASPKTHTLVIEAAIDSRPKSKMGKLIQAIGGKRSYFEPLQNEKAPLSLALSWGLGRSDRKLMIDSLRLMGARLTAVLDPASITWKPPERKLPKLKPAEKKPAASGKPKRRRGRFRRARRYQPGPLADYRKDGPAGDVIEPLIATAEKGHADFFLQFAGEPPARFSLLAGLRVQDGRRLARGLKAVLEKLKQRKNAPPIQINVDSHRGIAFHRIRFPRVTAQMKRFFGASPAVYVGAGSQAVWLAIGEESAFKDLRGAIDKVLDRKGTVVRNRSVAPFKLAVNVASWLAMGGEGDGPSRPMRDLARKAFAKGGDEVRVEIRTTENGLRLRAQFGSGFLKFLGLSIARRYERRLGI